MAGPSLQEGSTRSRNEERRTTCHENSFTPAPQQVSGSGTDTTGGCPLGEILGAAVEAIGLAVVGLRLLRNDAGSPAVPERTRLHRRA